MRLVQLAVIVLVWGTVLHWVTRTPRKGKTGMTQAACPGRKNPACTCTGSCGTTPGPGHCLCTECVSITIRKASGALSGTTASSAPLASLFGFPAQGPRLGSGGVTGFDGARAKGSDDYEFAIGSVHGLRQWKLPFDSLLHTIMATDQQPCTEALWPAGSQPPLLAGVTGFTWPPGVVEARCKNFPDHEPPVEYDPARKGSCGCGFWGYWKMADQTWHDKLPVFGIMEGTGRVVIGSKGFRAQKARIIALVPAFAIDVATTPDPVPGPYYGSWQQQSSPYELAVPELSPAGAGDREREVAESRQRADAWLGVIMELLGLMYPEARVFATLKGMLACVPPGEVTQ